MSAVNPAGKVIVVTGGASGIGAALVRRFVTEGASYVAAADICEPAGLPGRGFQVDVSREDELRRLVEAVEAEAGPIDLLCSNAGILREGGSDAPDAAWEQSWQVNVMAHVYAARAVLPGMLARGSGYLLQTVSAAGLLSQIGAAPYAVTKHAALAFAEWLAITHYEQGVRVSALCPQGVLTPMLEHAGEDGLARRLRETAISCEQVADAVMEGLADERFLILPHPEVAEYFRRRGTDHERWLRGMRRLQAEMG